MSSGSLTTFKFDAALTETLEQIKDKTSASSKAEVVRRAIALLKLVEEANSKGEKIVLRKEDNEGHVIREREIVMP